MIRSPISWKNWSPKIYLRIDLGELIAKDVERYLRTYIEELSHTNVYREIISR